MLQNHFFLFWYRKFQYMQHSGGGELLSRGGLRAAHGFFIFQSMQLFQSSQKGTFFWKKELNGKVWKIALKTNLCRQVFYDKNYTWTGRSNGQTTLLKRVDLTVNKDPTGDKYQWLLTDVEFKDGEYQDPCAGDSGGPLMYKNQQSDGSAKWVIIGELASRTFGRSSPSYV